MPTEKREETTAVGPSEAGGEAPVAVPASGYPFGPEFFLESLRSFVRDRCPDPAEALPLVEVHLADGSLFNLCHVIAVTSSWLALAVRDDRGHEGDMEMHTELVPYGLICRVTIRGHAPNSTSVGFNIAHEPFVEEACGDHASAPECSLLARDPPHGGGRDEP